MTIYDISQKAGVSIASVSRVLNGKKGVGEKTRQRILAAMEETAYIPNAFARGMGLGSIQTVGVMCTDVADLYQATAVSVIERELRQRGYEAVLSCTGAKSRENNMQMLLAKQVDAVILVGSHFLTESCHYIQHAAAQVPIILINGYYKADGVYCLLCNEYDLMRRVTRALLEKGRRNILYLYDSTSYSGRQKLDGYKAGLAEAGYAPSSTHILQCPRNMDEVPNLLQSLSRQEIPFDAVLCSEDELAVGALKYARGCGLGVPEQMDVVGCNNSVLARASVPELTSVDNKIEALCTMAVTTLFGVLGGGAYPDKIVLSGELVGRESAFIQL